MNAILPLNNELLSALARVISSDNDVLLHKSQGKFDEALFVGKGKETNKAKSKAVNKKLPLLTTKKTNGKTYVTGLTDEGIRYYIRNGRFDLDSLDTIRPELRARILEQLGRKISDELNQTNGSIERFASAVQAQVDEMLTVSERLAAKLQDVNMRIEREFSNQTYIPNANGNGEVNGRSKVNQALAEWTESSIGPDRSNAEATLASLGAEKFEVAGKVTEFDKHRHISTKPILPGSRVQVLREGWIHDNQVVCKARVRAISD